MVKNEEEICSLILDIFAQSGIVVNNVDLSQDFDLREFVDESIQFITALVEIENSLDIVLPEELLLLECLASFRGFCQSIIEIVNSSNQKWDAPFSE